MGYWIDAVGAEAEPDGAEEKSGEAPSPVHLVDGADAHQAGSALTPTCFDRLDASTSNTAQQRRRGRRRRSATDGVVDVPVSISCTCDHHRPGPRACGGGGLDGDAALLLFLEEVHGGGALVDLADLVVLAGVVEDAARRRWSCLRRCGRRCRSCGYSSEGWGAWDSRCRM